MNLDTDKMTRQKNLYLDINSFHTKRKRIKHVKLLVQSLEELLEKGYSPYETENSTEEKLSIKNAFNFSLSLKKSSVSNTTFVSYKNRINHFLKWLDKHELSNYPIRDLDKKVVVNYLNEVVKNSSPANRNNTRLVLSALLDLLKKQDIIKNNFIHDIEALKTTPTRNKTYKKQEVEVIFAFIKQNNPILLLFIKFIAYNFLRPIKLQC